jgi:hypothetical protein
MPNPWLNEHKSTAAMNYFFKYTQNINFLNVDWRSNWKEKLYKWRASVVILLLLPRIAQFSNL